MFKCEFLTVGVWRVISVDLWDCWDFYHWFKENRKSDHTVGKIQHTESQNNLNVWPEFGHGLKTLGSINSPYWCEELMLCWGKYNLVTF